MPNWVENRIIFYGKNKDLLAVLNCLTNSNYKNIVDGLDSLQECEDEVVSLANFMPIPSEMNIGGFFQNTYKKYLQMYKFSLSDKEKYQFDKEWKDYAEHKSFERSTFLPSVEIDADCENYVQKALQIADKTLTDYKSINEAIESLEKIKTNPFTESESQFALTLLLSYGANYRSVINSAVDIGKILFQSIKKYNAYFWYDWCVLNWGTKWNCCNSEVYAYSKEASTEILKNEGMKKIPKNLSSFQAFFQTAYNAPLEFFEKFCKNFPDVIVQIDYADEDIGANTNRLILKNNTLLTKFPLNERYNKLSKEEREERIRFACSVWDYDPDEYLYDDDDC